MKARDRATIEAERDRVSAEIADLTAREIELQEELARVRQRLSAFVGFRTNVPRDLDNELADADLVIVDGGPRDDYVIVSLTRGQAAVRKYGSGTYGNQTIIRAGSRWAPVSLEQCRNAWVAAGRRLP